MALFYKKIELAKKLTEAPVGAKPEADEPAAGADEETAGKAATATARRPIFGPGKKTSEAKPAKKAEEPDPGDAGDEENAPDEGPGGKGLGDAGDEDSGDEDSGAGAGGGAEEGDAGADEGGDMGDQSSAMGNEKDKKLRLFSEFEDANGITNELLDAVEKARSSATDRKTKAVLGSLRDYLQDASDKMASIMTRKFQKADYKNLVLTFVALKTTVKIVASVFEQIAAEPPGQEGDAGSSTP